MIVSVAKVQDITKMLSKVAKVAEVVTRIESARRM
jgi:hypothetical protein